MKRQPSVLDDPPSVADHISLRIANARGGTFVEVEYVASELPAILDSTGPQASLRSIDAFGSEQREEFEKPVGWSIRLTELPGASLATRVGESPRCFRLDAMIDREGVYLSRIRNDHGDPSLHLRREALRACAPQSLGAIEGLADRKIWTYCIGEVPSQMLDLVRPAYSEAEES